jgi:hypothetical protein
MQRLVKEQGIFDVVTTRCLLHGADLAARVKELAQDEIFSAVVAKAMESKVETPNQDSRDCDDRTQKNSRDCDEPSRTFDDSSRDCDGSSRGFDDRRVTLYIQPSTIQSSMKKEPSTLASPLSTSLSLTEGGVQVQNIDSVATCVPLEPSMIEDSKTEQSTRASDPVATKPAPKSWRDLPPQYLELSPENAANGDSGAHPSYDPPSGPGKFRLGWTSAEQSPEEDEEKEVFNPYRRRVL